MFEGSLQVYW